MTRYRNPLTTAAQALLLAFVSLLAVAQTQAQSLTPAQIARFQSMSQSEQERLARQYGVELPKRDTSQQTEQQPEQTIITREQAEQRRQEAQKEFEEKTIDGLPLFGYKLFAGFPTSFTPLADIPVPADYVVGPGDEISVQLYGKENERHLLTVGRDGTIDFPRLGPIPVAGKTFTQVREDLKTRIRNQIIGAEVAIGMGQLRLMQVYVLGDAYRPGAYNLSSLSTVTQALIAAGGIAETGSLRRIEVRRGKEKVVELDLYDLLIRGDRGGDIRLQSGDAVFVRPVENRIAVDGEILRPAVYEGLPGTTLAEIVATAGGLTPEGFSERVTIERRTDAGRTVYTRDLTSPEGRNFRLQGGDKVLIAPRPVGFRSAVTVSGAFVRAGKVEYSEGMRVTDLLARPETTLRDDADLSMALLVHSSGNGQIAVDYIPLQRVLENPDLSLNRTLQPRDELIVLPGTDYYRCSADDLFEQRKRREEKRRERQQAEIQGELRQAGNRGELPRGENREELQRAQNGQRVENGQRFENGDEPAFEELKKIHCGPRAKYSRYLPEDLPELKGPQRADGEGKTTRLKKHGEEETLELLQKEREALLAPVLEKIRLQTGSGDVQPIVEVRGEVKYPGVYPYQPDMNLADLFSIAGGVLESGFSRQAELTRVRRESPGDLALQHITLTLDNTGDRHFILAPRDRVTIFQNPAWRNDLTVEVQGEVQFPGTYTIQRGETLADLVRRAGGFTRFAFPDGAVFSRESLREKEEQELNRLRTRLKEQIATLSLQKGGPASGLSVSPQEAIEVVEKLDEVEALGRLAINLPAAVKGSNSHDIILENGDQLYVPNRSNTVTVVGEVQYPSSHVFEEGLTYKEYLERAGGPRERADESRIYVIRANGQVAMPRNSWFGMKIREGDTIVVPIDADYTDKLTLFSTVSQILFQLGVTYDVFKD